MTPSGKVTLNPHAEPSGEFTGQFTQGARSMVLACWRLCPLFTLLHAFPTTTLLGVRIIFVAVRTS
jgi:hypothetical protein